MKKALATLSLIALFRVMAFAPLPGIDHSNFGFSDTPERLSVMAIGLLPLVTAFMIVELWSFVFRKGRRLRRGGTEGRQRLNTFALRVAVAVALIQGAGIAFALIRQPGLVLDPGYLFLLMTMVTLAAGTAITYLIGQSISRWGIGNGFCLLAVTPLAWSSVRNVAESVSSGEFFSSAFEPLLWIAAMGALLKICLHRPEIQLKGNQAEEISVTLSAFPQGFAPVLDTSSLINLIYSFLLFFEGGSAALANAFQSSISAPVIAVILTALCFVDFHLFSSRKRLESNLPTGTLETGINVPAIRWLIPTSVFLVIFGTVFRFGNSIGFHSTQILRLPALVLLTALLLDLIAEIRFLLRYDGKVEPLIEMDNIHGACYLRGFLAKAEIDSVTRAFQYRSLLYFFGPLIKMKIFVPTADLMRAQELVRTLNLEVV